MSIQSIVTKEILAALTSPGSEITVYDIGREVVPVEWWIEENQIRFTVEKESVVDSVFFLGYLVKFTQWRTLFPEDVAIIDLSEIEEWRRL